MGIDEGHSSRFFARVREAEGGDKRAEVSEGPDTGALGNSQTAAPRTGRPHPGAPADLSAETELWIRKAMDLAKRYAVGDIASGLQMLDARRRMPGFRLAFVGESNRGKSTLINRLFDRPLLPAGPLPNRTTVTFISAGTQERMEVSFSGNRRESRTLEESSWEDLLEADQEGLAKVVRLTVDSPWLRNIDAELVDTPGAAEESGGDRAAMIFEVLGSCDAAVLLISATSPFSRTESTFLEEELVGRHVARILVVISNLDRIGAKERERVFEVIRQRVAEASPAVPVVASYPPEDGTTPATALEMVRNEIEAIAVRDDRRVWRSRQVAAQTADYLAQLVEFGNARAAVVKMGAEEREKVLRMARDELRTTELRWQDLRLELDRRRLANYQQLRSRVLETKPELLEGLTLELMKTPNPRVWWEEELPLKLQQELVAAGRTAKEFVLEALARDFGWLQEEVKNSFGAEIAGREQEVGGLEIRANPGPLPVDELGPWRVFASFGQDVTQLITRFSGPAALAISYALRATSQGKSSASVQQGRTNSAVVGSSAATKPGRAAEMDALAQVLQVALESGAQLGSGFMDDLLNRKVDDQRKLISRKLELTLDRAYEEYCERMGERMRQLYDQLSEDTKRQQVAWRSARILALEEDDGTPDEQTWGELVDEATNMKKEILAALES